MLPLTPTRTLNLPSRQFKLSPLIVDDRPHYRSRTAASWIAIAKDKYRDLPSL
jgi:hypothetical protein